jgi:autotransporter-associated beta strand protein
MGYALEITGTNPPVLTIDPGVTLQIGTNSSADDHPNIIATSDSKNPASVVNGEVNLDNILNNGRIVLNSAHLILLGQVSGTGSITQPMSVWGGNSMGGVSDFSGVLSLSTGQDFGTNHVAASIPKAKAVLNEGSWLVWSPPNATIAVSQDIYEAAYGNDINFHPIGNSKIVMSGVYSHTDNGPHGNPNLVDPGLSDLSLNMAKVIYRGGANDSNGNDGSYRGINIEAGGTVQWGDGTHARFFLPSAPSPADVNPPLGKKNAYINLHRGGTLAFNYNGPVTLHVGITGGGGGPDKSQTAGLGNVWIMPTEGNDVTFAQPQNYNGTTTIGAGAILRLGTGTPVPLHYVTVDASGNKTRVLQATYSGDSSLLTAESPGGAATDAIVNDGRLIVRNTSTDITLSNISGVGSFSHDGAAVTTLLRNTFSGGTTIEAGTVPAASADALGTGDVTNDAVLGLASTQHELTVGGGFRKGGGGTLSLSIGGEARDHLAVSGPAVLGGTLRLTFSGSHSPGERIALIDAEGGISGAFDSISSEGASVVAGSDGTRFFVTVQ